MAREPAKSMNFSYNAVSIEDELSSVEMNVENGLADVTALADTAHEFVEEIPDGTFSLEGSADFVDSQGDDTIFSQIGSGEAAVVMQPTGAAAAANEPNYTCNALVRNYRITSRVGGGCRYSATLQANGPISRAVA